MGTHPCVRFPLSKTMEDMGVQPPPSQGAMRPPLKSIFAQDVNAETLPWEDVIIDVQGSLTRSEDGMLYIL